MATDVPTPHARGADAATARRFAPRLSRSWRPTRISRRRFFARGRRRDFPAATFAAEEIPAENASAQVSREKLPRNLEPTSGAGGFHGDVPAVDDEAIGDQSRNCAVGIGSVGRQCDIPPPGGRIRSRNQSAHGRRARGRGRKTGDVIRKRSEPRSTPPQLPLTVGSGVTATGLGVGVTCGALPLVDGAAALIAPAAARAGFFSR